MAAAFDLGCLLLVEYDEQSAISLAYLKHSYSLRDANRLPL